MNNNLWHSSLFRCADFRFVHFPYLNGVCFLCGELMCGLWSSQHFARYVAQIKKMLLIKFRYVWHRIWRGFIVMRVNAQHSNRNRIDGEKRER